MITVSSITKNTGRYAMIRTAFFYISVNLLHYVTSYMHHTGKKEIKKEGYEKFASRGFEPRPSESVRTKTSSFQWKMSCCE